ncbi:MAG TPA: hypothetical protein VF753_02375 [Terriglobales bacterium]
MGCLIVILLFLVAWALFGLLGAIVVGLLVMIVGILLMIAASA